MEMAFRGTYILKQVFKYWVGTINNRKAKFLSANMQMFVRKKQFCVQ
jgi:hypothetical protein